MKITDVEAPDGSIIKVEHPEGADQAAILNFAKQEYENRQFAASLPSGLDRLKKESEPQGGSIADSLGQGLSFGFSDEIAGALGAAVGTFDPNLEGTTFGERFRGIRDAARDNAAAFSERNPGTALASEIGGGLLTGGFGAARAGAFQAAKNAPTLAGKLQPIVQTGVTQGGLIGAGKSEADDLKGVARDTLEGAAIGGITAPILPLLGAPIKSGASRAVQAVDSPQFRSAVRRLEKSTGIRLTTGQKTGSEPLRSVESTLADSFLGGSINRALATNRQKVQGRLMEMAGFEADDAARGLFTREAFDAAQNRFSQRYSDLTSGKAVDLSSNNFIDDIARVESKHLQLLDPLQRRQVTQIIDAFLDEATKGPITGKVYQATRSRLGQLAKSSQSNPTISGLYRDLKTALDDAFFEQAGSKAVRRTLDQQYGRFKQLLNTFESSGSIGSTRGELPFSMLTRRAAKQPDREFEQIVRDAQAVLGDPVANSGTPSRLLNLALLGSSGGSAMTGGLDAGALSVGVPLGTSIGLSRGVTGGTVAERLGLLSAPATTPILGDFAADPQNR